MGTLRPDTRSELESRGVHWASETWYEESYCPNGCTAKQHITFAWGAAENIERLPRRSEPV
jgi:hypothetical protein